MQYGVDRRFSYCHGNVRDGIFVEAGTPGDVFCRPLQLVYALQRRGERHRDAVRRHRQRQAPVVWVEMADDGSVLGVRGKVKHCQQLPTAGIRPIVSSLPTRPRCTLLR